MRTAAMIVIALALAVGFRLAGGLLGEIAAIVCVVAAVGIAAAAWRRGHPRAGEQLDDEEAHRVEEEKLARYGTKL